MAHTARILLYTGLTPSSVCHYTTQHILSSLGHIQSCPHPTPSALMEEVCARVWVGTRFQNELQLGVHLSFGTTITKIIWQRNVGTDWLILSSMSKNLFNMVFSWWSHVVPADLHGTQTDKKPLFLPALLPPVSQPGWLRGSCREPFCWIFSGQASSHPFQKL